MNFLVASTWGVNWSLSDILPAPLRAAARLRACVRTNSVNYTAISYSTPRNRVLVRSSCGQKLNLKFISEFCTIVLVDRMLNHPSSLHYRTNLHLFQSDFYTQLRRWARRQDNLRQQLSTPSRAPLSTASLLIIMVHPEERLMVVQRLWGAQIRCERVPLLWAPSSDVLLDFCTY